MKVTVSILFCWWQCELILCYEHNTGLCGWDDLSAETIAQQTDGDTALVVQRTLNALGANKSQTIWEFLLLNYRLYLIVKAAGRVSSCAAPDSPAWPECWRVVNHAADNVHYWQGGRRWPAIVVEMMDVTSTLCRARAGRHCSFCQQGSTTSFHHLLSTMCYCQTLHNE